MKVFEPENIRNIAFIGHGDAGKTSLVSAILYSAGAVNRLGRVDDGTTVTDYDEDEIARKITLNSALAFCEWNKTKINLIDTPGYRAFMHDAKSVLPAAEAAVVVVDAVSGVEVQTELVWDYAGEFELPRLIVINKMDRDRASFERTMQSIESTWGRIAVPIQIPIGEEKDFKGVIDLLRNRAYVYRMDGSGNFTEQDIPEDQADSASSMREKLIEMVAESNDALMEKFFESGTLAEEEIISGLKEGVLEGKVVPVMITAATANATVKQLLDHIVELVP